MKNRFLGGISFLPLLAPEGAGSDAQPELALEQQPQKDDFAEKLEAAAEVDQNDPNDLNHKAEDEVEEQPEVKAEPVKAEEKTEEEPAEKDPEEVEQLRKTVKALGKRVSTLSREKRDLHAKLQENIKPVAEQAASGDEPEAPQREDFKTKAEFDIAVKAEAARQRAVEEFNAKCNAVETAGSKAFGGEKWAKAKQDLAMLDDMGSIPLDLLSVALETDDPSAVLFKLGNNIDLATELMGMTPIKRAIAMDKLASAPKQTQRQQSRTPPPIEPIGAKGASDDRPRDTDSDEEWNRKEAIRERKVLEEKRRRLGLA